MKMYKKALGLQDRHGSDLMEAHQHSKNNSVETREVISQLASLQSIKSSDSDTKEAILVDDPQSQTDLQKLSDRAVVEIDVVDQGASSQRSSARQMNSAAQPSNKQVFDYVRHQKNKDSHNSDIDASNFATKGRDRQTIKSSGSEVIWDEGIVVDYEYGEETNKNHQDFEKLEISTEGMHTYSVKEDSKSQSRDMVNSDGVPSKHQTVTSKDEEEQPLAQEQDKTHQASIEHTRTMSATDSEEIDINVKLAEEITDKILTWLLEDDLENQRLESTFLRKLPKTIMSIPEYNKKHVQMNSPPINSRLVKPEVLRTGEKMEVEVQDPNFNINQEIVGGEQIIAGVDTSLEAVEQYIEGIFAQIRIRGR